MPKTIIDSVQFKRGRKETLEKKLTKDALGVLLPGEPAFEIDTGNLKIGNGISDYSELPYIKGNLEDSFLITSPLENQILIYDATLGKWVNKTLTDNESIIYLDSNTNGLSIKGYKEASQGQMLVKDRAKGIAWIDPLSDETLRLHTAAAEQSAQRAGNAAVQANNEYIKADQRVAEATRINEATLEAVNNKFWWGTVKEYNALDHVDAGTFYFVTHDSSEQEDIN